MDVYDGRMWVRYTSASKSGVIPMKMMRPSGRVFTILICKISFTIYFVN